MAGLMCFADAVETPLESNAELRAEFRAVCWVITSTYQVTDNLYIGQLEEEMTHLRMGKQETVTDYYKRARRLLACMQMAGVEYSTASYITHVIKGLRSSYNMMKRLLVVPGMWESLNEDSLTSHILRDEAMQEAQKSTELLPQANYVAPTNQGGQPGQRGKPGGGGSGGGKPAKDADKKKLAKDGGCGEGGRRRECWLCGDPDHLSFECPDRTDSDDDDTKGGRGRSAGRHPRHESKPCKGKQSTKSTSAKDADSSLGGKGRGDVEASCLLVGVVEPNVLLAPKAGEDFQVLAAAVQANTTVVLLDSDCSHHLMGTKAAFVDLKPSRDVKHMRGFNGVMQDANLLSASHLKKSGMKLQDDGDGMLLILSVGDVLGRATYTGRVLCIDLRPYSAKLMSTTMETVALQAIVSAATSTPARRHAGLAHIGVDTITSSAKQEVATGLDIKPSAGNGSPCVSCVGRKLARHTFPNKGSNADEALAIVHIDLCGPFRVAAKDGSLYFLLPKNCKTRYVWVRPVAKKSDMLREFEKWLLVAKKHTKKSVLMLRSDQGGEFHGKEFADLLDGKGIVHVLTCPYTL
ncbi:unnamed protein product [Closterium sp. NIES-54]